MSHLSEAEVMLLAWGSWQRGNEHNGYSTINILGRIIDEGCGASHSTTTREPHMSASVEIAEYCILHMTKPLQRVCKHKFIGLEPDIVAAKKLRTTLDIYQTRVNQAILVVAEYVKTSEYFRIYFRLLTSNKF